MITTCAFSPLLILLFFFYHHPIIYDIYDLLFILASTVAAPVSHIASRTHKHVKRFAIIVRIFSFKKNMRSETYGAEILNLFLTIIV